MTISQVKKMLGLERQSDSLGVKEQHLEVKVSRGPSPRASLFGVGPGVKKGHGRVEDRLRDRQSEDRQSEDRWRKWLAGRGSHMVPSMEEG